MCFLWKSKLAKSSLFFMKLDLLLPFPNILLGSILHLPTKPPAPWYVHFGNLLVTKMPAGKRKGVCLHKMEGLFLAGYNRGPLDFPRSTREQKQGCIGQMLWCSKYGETPIWIPLINQNVTNQQSMVVEICHLLHALVFLWHCYNMQQCQHTQDPSALCWCLCWVATFPTTQSCCAGHVRAVPSWCFCAPEDYFVFVVRFSALVSSFNAVTLCAGVNTPITPLFCVSVPIV